jgi:hypothetical protein
MSRAQKDLRRALAPLTGIPEQGNALLREAAPSAQGVPLAQRVKDAEHAVNKGLPRRIA